MGSSGPANHERRRIRLNAIIEVELFTCLYRDSYGFKPNCS